MFYRVSLEKHHIKPKFHLQVFS